MIIIFLKKEFFKDNIDYIYLLYNKYNLLIKLIESSDDIKKIIESFKDEQEKINYIFCGYSDIKLFKELKLNYNLIIFFMHPKINDEIEEELENIHKQIKFITIFHEKDKLLYYNYDKCLLNLDEDNKDYFKTFFNKYQINDDFGFIILRSVNSKISNEYWLKNILQIRKFYYHKIYIIDDNSNKKYFTPANIDHLKDINIIKSDYSKRGEILGYYYLYEKKLFKKAIILHDSVFINKYIDFDKYNSNVNYLWHFGHHANNYNQEIHMINLLNKSKRLKEIYDAKEWLGCFGGISIIKYDFLKEIQDKFGIFNLIDYIDSRSKRMDFERIFSVLCAELDSNIYKNESIYGNIFDYIKWEYSFNEYKEDLKNNNEKLNKLDLVKTWSGR